MTRQGHILVTDDNLVNRKLLQRALEDQGYTVSLAEDGRRALAALGGAAAVEAASFEAASLDGVAARDDALGGLARVFQRMAREVQAREERLRRQVQELRIEIDEARQAKKVAEITESDYFRQLRGQAEQ